MPQCESPVSFLADVDKRPSPIRVDRDSVRLGQGWHFGACRPIYLNESNGFAMPDAPGARFKPSAGSQETFGQSDVLWVRTFGYRSVRLLTCDGSLRSTWFNREDLGRPRCHRAGQEST